MTNNADCARLDGRLALAFMGRRVIRSERHGEIGIGVGVGCLEGTLLGDPFGCGAWNVRNGLVACCDTNGTSSCVIIGTLCSGA